MQFSTLKTPEPFFATSPIPAAKGLLNFITAGAALIALAFLAAISARADTITLTAVNTTSTYYLASNTVTEVTYTYGINYGLYSVKVTPTNSLTATYPGTSNLSISNAPIIVGPATIQLVNSSSTLAICTLKTYPSTSVTNNFIPSNAVVIPVDNGGPVTIILESSTDLVNWTAALPGTYGTSSTNRFFRVRATR